MPPRSSAGDTMKKGLDIAFLGTLVLALAAAATTLGLVAHFNIGEFCVLFITKSSFSENGMFGGKRAACGLSLAGAIIATVCLAIVTLLEFNKFIFKSNIR